MGGVRQKWLGSDTQMGAKVEVSQFLVLFDFVGCFFANRFCTFSISISELELKFPTLNCHRLPASIDCLPLSHARPC